MANEAEQYREFLEAKNGYCSCPTLAELFAQRKKAESLEKRCEFFKTEVDLANPKAEDLKFLKDYRQLVLEFRKACKDYYKTLNDSILQGTAVLNLHDAQKKSLVGRIKYEQAAPIVKNASKNLIITVNCSNCDQQIDLAD